tara:strand:+ start:2608 stop:3660 length:1053 start_codon:yes stop_codon:yes gene_type:complete
MPAATTTLPPTTTTKAPDPLVIGTNEIPGGTTGGTYLVFLKGSGGTPPLEWSINEGELPPGLELLPSGLIRGTPRTSGQFSFALRVDDSEGQAAGEIFSLEFVDPLSIDTSSVKDVLVGSQFNSTLLASGGKAPYTWKIEEGTLPEGILFQEDGSFAGSTENKGVFGLTIRLTDSTENFVDRQFSLKVVEPIKVQTILLPSAVSGVEYSMQMLAVGGSPPYVWNLSDGVLPEGLELLSSGILEGIPEIVTKTAPTIRVSDSEGRSTSFTYEISVLVGQEQQVIAARGGKVIIEITNNALKYIENTPNDGFIGYLVFSSSEKIQVHFIGEENQIPSWVLCEISSSGICSFD